MIHTISRFFPPAKGYFYKVGFFSPEQGKREDVILQIPSLREKKIQEKNKVRIYGERDPDSRYSIFCHALSLKNADPDQRQKQEQYNIHDGEFQKVAPGMGVVGVGVELHADEARKTCDRGAESANVHTQQQGVGLIGKSGEQQCGGNVADDLAGEQGDQILFP